MSDVCKPQHDVFADVLSAGLCLGLIASYLPQHLRIIKAKTSEGFSPWFLLLGSISAASGMLNIIIKQWGIIKCCKVWSAGTCIESTAGIFQLALIWVLFTIILVLYMIYYPQHLKFATVLDQHDGLPPRQLKTGVKQDGWRLSITLSWVVLLYTLLIMFVTFMLLGTQPSPDTSRRSLQLDMWATFLGVSSTIEAAIQYFPQIMHTYRHKLVGALSIPMMFIQTPGAFIMVLSIALRPGTNWTTWLTYAAAGILQGSLLVMCIMWKARQHRLGIDDFGNPIAEHSREPAPASPVSIIQGPRDGTPVQQAVNEAVQTDLRSQETEDDHQAETHEPHEDTPLLKKDTDGNSGRTWFGWLIPQRR